MSQDVRKVINIIGAALFVGIALRYSTAVQGLISTGSKAFADIYGTVSLQNVAMPNGPTNTQQLGTSGNLPWGH